MLHLTAASGFCTDAPDLATLGGAFEGAMLMTHPSDSTEQE